MAGAMPGSNRTMTTQQLRTRPTAIAIALAVLSFVGIATAHGIGASLEQAVGTYRVDVGYEPEERRVQETVRLDFSLLNEETKASVPFTSVWVRMIRSSETVFAGGIAKASFGPTGLTYAFPAAGAYELSVRFQNGDETIAETSFPLAVAAAEATARPAISFDIMSALIGLAVGALGVWLLRKGMRA